MKCGRCVPVTANTGEVCGQRMNAFWCRTKKWRSPAVVESRFSLGVQMLWMFLSWLINFPWATRLFYNLPFAVIISNCFNQDNIRSSRGSLIPKQNGFHVAVWGGFTVCRCLSAVLNWPQADGWKPCSATSFSCVIVVMWQRWGAVSNNQQVNKN